MKDKNAKTQMIDCLIELEVGHIITQIVKMNTPLFLREQTILSCNPITNKSFNKWVVSKKEQGVITGKWFLRIEVVATAVNLIAGF